MKRALLIAITCIAFFGLLTLGSNVADAALPIPDGQQPGHAVDVNGSGDLVIAAVKESGRLYTRTLIDGDWSGWQIQGLDTWVSADVAIDDAGTIALIGLKQSGALWTRDWTAATGWGSWSSQGLPTWSTDSVPSIDIADGFTHFAAVKEFGALYTRSRSDGGNWSGWVEHGRRTWAHADIAVSNGGFSVLAGSKLDGRLYTRVVGRRGGDWHRHGLPTWSTSTTPSISMHGNALALAAVKVDGRAYVRTGRYTSNGVVADDRWNEFDAPIRRDAAGIAVAATSGRTIAAIGTNSGALHQVTMFADSTETATSLGFASGSFSVPPSSAAGPSDDIALAVNSDGSLTLFRHGGAEESSVSLGRSTWASGDATRPPTPTATPTPTPSPTPTATATPTPTPSPTPTATPTPTPTPTPTATPTPTPTLLPDPQIPGPLEHAPLDAVPVPYPNTRDYNQRRNALRFEFDGIGTPTAGEYPFGSPIEPVADLISLTLGLEPERAGDTMVWGSPLPLVTLTVADERLAAFAVDLATGVVVLGSTLVDHL